MSVYDEDDEEVDENGEPVTFNQYSVFKGGKYQPIVEAVAGLPAGFYKAEVDYAGHVTFIKTDMVTDELLDIPDSLVSEVFEDMKVFWGQGEVYKNYKLTHKRGYLLHGPPGTGKTSLVVMLGRKVVEAGGIVIIPDDDRAFACSAEVVRTSEVGRSIMFVLEELNELLDKNKADALSVLDGESSVDNCLFVATTNYLNDLSEQIRNRPGRFDRVLYVKAPSPRARESYAKTLLLRDATLPASQVADLATRIAELTQGLSIAHVREAIIAHRILGQDLKVLYDRFKEARSKSTDEKG